MDSGRLPVCDLENMVKSWVIARRDCMTVKQERSIQETVYQSYGRIVYEHIFNSSFYWDKA